MHLCCMIGKKFIRRLEILNYSGCYTISSKKFFFKLYLRVFYKYFVIDETIIFCNYGILM